MNILIIAIIVFAVIKVLSATSAKVKENKRQAELARVKAEQIRQREDLKRQQAEARAWTQRQIALEQQAMRREREEAEAWRKQLAWDAKQEEINRKNEERFAKIEYTLQRCTEDIEHLNYKIEECQAYSEYLESERDKCSYGSGEYFKWQNKLSANDDKIYRLTKQMDKALFQKQQAEKKLSA